MIGYGVLLMRVMVGVPWNSDHDKEVSNIRRMI